MTFFSEVPRRWHAGSALPSVARCDRILIVKLGAIGDVVHALPLLCRLRRGLPGSRIAWAVGPKAAPLLRGHPALDEALVLEKRDLASWPGFVRKLRARRFDLAIDLQGLFVSGALARLSGAPRRLGFDRARSRELAWAFANARVPARDGRDRPVVRQYLEVAEHLGLGPADEGPLEFGLVPDRDALATAQALLGSAAGRKCAALVLGAGKEANRWSAEAFGELARRLRREDGVEVVLVGGAEDAGAARAVARVAGTERSSPIDLVGRCDLRATTAVLASCDVAVGGDTGPIHIAAALGTPVVALFGGANPRRTGPTGSGPVRVVYKAWRCSPCYLRHCPIGRECLAVIGAAEVRQAVMEALAKRDQPSDLPDEALARRLATSSSSTCSKSA